MKSVRKLFAPIVAVLALSAAVLVGSSSSAGAAILTATCNNTSTDSATIQGVINGSTGGDVVQIHGPCSLTATITLRDNRMYAGDGKSSTILKQANGANLKTIVAMNTYTNNNTFGNVQITIRDLTIDGNKANNTMAAGGAALVLRAYDSLIENVEVNNSARDGILISNASDNGTALSGSSVNSTIRNVFVQFSGESAIHEVDAGASFTDWTLQNGWLSGTGTGFPAVKLDNSAGWQIHNLHVYGVGTDAMYLGRCYATRVTDNYIEEFGAQGSNGVAYHGIMCQAQGDSASVINNNIINHFGALAGTTATFEYLRVEGNYNTPVLSVTGNVIRGQNTSREKGLVYSAGGATAMQVASTGNSIFNVAPNGTVEVSGPGVNIGAGQ